MCFAQELLYNKNYFVIKKGVIAYYTLAKPKTVAARQ